MSPEALSELIFNIANNLVNEGKAGTLTTDLIPPQAKFAVMRPKDRAHGDWASNAAMQLAKKAGMKPHDFAELFAAELANADGIKSVEVAGPGFINIVLDSASAAAVVDTVLGEGANYGKNDHLSGKTLNLEFVSANPTGPIHIGGTRWAAVGDSMARVLEANGAKVVREYYFNDHGEQINRFAKSLVAAAHGEETPIDGYKGAYIDEIARRVIDEANADGVAILDLPRVDGGVDNDGNPLGEGDSEQREEFRKRAVPMMFDEIRKSMKDFRVNFDVWFHENSLYSDGEVDKAIADLRERGDIYEKDGATWFESTKHGDDKDRVIIKSDGNYAYFAADIAYYRNKRHRDNDPADIAIYMLGADHHGYIGRMMAMCAAFGDEPGENMQILIGQLVNVLKDGKAVRMSKRAGNVVTIDDLTDAIESLLSPLKFIGLKNAVHTLAMMMTIALRFIPTLIEEAEKIMNAQKARGADLENGSLKDRVKALIPILIPLLISAVRRAYELAEAMECRCYSGGEGRTRMKQMHLKARDLWVSLVSAAMCGGVIALNILF